MTVNEKASYIKGLAEGLNFDATTPEGKIIKALMDLVDDLAREVVHNQEDIEYLKGYVDELDEDLGAVEDIVYGDDYEDVPDEDICDGDCENCDQDCDFGDEEDEDGEYFEVVCPSCGETVCFDESIDSDNLICPACGEKFECIIDEDDKETIKKAQATKKAKE